MCYSTARIFSTVTEGGGQGRVVITASRVNGGIIIMWPVQEAGTVSLSERQPGTHWFAARFITASNCFNWSYMRDWALQQIPLLSRCHCSPRESRLSLSLSRLTLLARNFRSILGYSIFG